jgi:mannose/fructose/N-acetylgalactosamine-specific phosphotransferase system component IIC
MTTAMAAAAIRNATASTGATTAIASATAAAMTTVMTVAMTATTAAIDVATAVAATTVAAEQRGRRLVLTAHQGDADEREKHRSSKNDDTIHSRILQIRYRYRKPKHQVAVMLPHLALDGVSSETRPCVPCENLAPSSC